MIRTVIVTTTIRMPVFLEDVCANVVRHGHGGETAITVIGDEKTPLGVGPYCRDVSQRFGLPITYLDIEVQEQALAPYSELVDLVPRNSGSRKFIGGFLAWRDGCQTLIFVDDDNFPTDIDFVGSHDIVGHTVADLPVVTSDTGWFNPYESLVEERGMPFFPRGFAWRERRNPPQSVRRERSLARVVLNSGLVLEDPDVDAATRLTWPIRVTAIRRDWAPNFALAPGTWSSFNDQNAAYAGDFIPAYFAPPSAGRNADIWGSYVVRRVADHFGDVVTYGYPLVKQLRNPHDYWEDLEREFLNARTTDAFTDFLRSIPLTEHSYLGAVGELIAGAQSRLPSLTGVPAAGMEMMERFFYEYQVWQQVMSRASRDRSRTEPAAITHHAS